GFSLAPYHTTPSISLGSLDVRKEDTMASTSTSESPKPSASASASASASSPLASSQHAPNSRHLPGSQSHYFSPSITPTTTKMPRYQILYALGSSGGGQLGIGRCE